MSGVPQPRHLSTTSTPLTNHCLYFEECTAYTRIYNGFQPPFEQNQVLQGFGSIVPPSPYLLHNVVKVPSADVQVIPLQDQVSKVLDPPDDSYAEKLHPSGYLAPGWKWNSFKTPSDRKRIVDCRLTTPILPEKPCHKFSRLLEASEILPPHPGPNYDHPPEIPVETVVSHVEQFYHNGLIPGEIPGYYCAAEYAGPRNFIGSTTHDPRGTALILPSEINTENFLTSGIGKMFIHVLSKRQLLASINKGMNCLITCAGLGAYALDNLPSVNFNPRLFSQRKGIHCYNPEGIKIQLILLLLYYQNGRLLTLFERCRWIVGSDIVELDGGGNHPT